MSESLFVAGACERAGGVGMTMLDARVLEERMQCDRCWDARCGWLWIVGGVWLFFRRAGGRGTFVEVRLKR